MDFLATSLQLAVPIHQLNLKSVPLDQLLGRTSESIHLLAEHGDKLLYGSKKPGEVAHLFNKTAEAIAILSFMPGGVKLFGQHWVAHHDG